MLRYMPFKAKDVPPEIPESDGRSFSVVVQGEQWDRQPNEGETAYRKFVYFRDMGPARTLADFVKQVGLDYHYCRTLSARNHWYARAEAWDRFNDTIHAVKMADERKRVVVKHLDIAEQFLDKVAARLAHIDVKKLNPDQLVRWADVATKMQRMALGFNDDGQQPGHPSVVVNLQANDHSQTLNVTERTMERMQVFRTLAKAHKAVQKGSEADIIDADPPDTDANSPAA